MDRNLLSYKIRKYTAKLMDAKTPEDSDFYREKLQEYIELQEDLKHEKQTGSSQTGGNIDIDANVDDNPEIDETLGETPEDDNQYGGADMTMTEAEFIESAPSNNEVKSLLLSIMSS